MLLSLAQAFARPGRPPSSWQPAWWQSQVWATLGFLMFLPSPILVVLFQEVGGVTSNYILFPALFVGVAGVIAIPCCLAYRLTTWFMRRRTAKA